ncbi:hypothetical protein ACVGVM_12910 [Pseudonocardia bannensis]|uniref:Uncharacterized protein n=1 Tax=Pseudonocardia bannensis TaxID=630973 RepID=A0A848DKL2_9PSEU|nr:hypothetical protein [Pseudonocardia bannensis]NMH93105.1 hypothetical protein [Pseudonocardia bannensis]
MPRPRWSHLAVAAGTAALTAGIISTVASPAPPSAAPPSAAPPSPASVLASPAATSTSPAAALPVGFAEPAVGARNLQVTALISKTSGGVSVTIAGVNIGNEPVTVVPRDLGPTGLTFRGASVPMSDPPAVRKRLVPGEAIVYACTVELPDMNSGTLAFTVAGVPISGQAAGD